MKKIGGYPYNGYPMNIDMNMGRIFIQLIKHGRVTIRPLPALLTSMSRR